METFGNTVDILGELRTFRDDEQRAKRLMFERLDLLTESIERLEKTISIMSGQLEEKRGRKQK